MKHEHHPHGQNTRDHTTQAGTRYQWAQCNCGVEMRRETTAEGSNPNWTNWQSVKELGLKS